MERKHSEDGRMDTRSWSTFNRKFWLFGMAALAAQKANYLLDEKNCFSFTDAQKREILRERKFALLSLELDFAELLELGIPPHMLLFHLQVDQPQE